jgi:hypothetical protein
MNHQHDQQRQHKQPLWPRHNHTAIRHTAKRPRDCHPAKFEAPAKLVFKAYTTLEPVKRWWGFETSQWPLFALVTVVGYTRWKIKPIAPRVTASA